MKRKSRQGFTLVEIMIVISVVAILAALAIPNFIGYRKTAHAQACKRNMHEIKTALQVYMMNHGGKYTTDLSKLVAAGGTGLVKKELSCPAGGSYTISYDTSKQMFDITCSEEDETDHNVKEEGGK